MLKKGWVKLHREIQENVVWTSTTPKQFKIFVALLLMVNHYPNTWEHNGEKKYCQPGQTITSLENLANASGPGVSIQNVRTSLKKFEKWGILTDESTKQGRLITLINWDFYQGNGEKLTDELTDNQQTTNRQLTTKKECKNVRMKESSIGGIPSESPALSYFDYKDKYKVDPEVDGAIEYFLASYEMELTGEQRNLKPDTWEGVVNSLFEVIDNNESYTGCISHNCGIEEMRDMMDGYFERVKNGVYDVSIPCISHFNNEHIKKVLFYTYCY